MPEKRFAMWSLQRIQTIILAAAIVFYGIFQYSTQAQSFSLLNLDASRVRWTDLAFHAKNFWVEVSTSVELVSLPFAEVEALLLPSPRGAPVKPATPHASQMTINTLIDPKFRSPVNIYNRIWFNPADAMALGRIWLRRGEDDFKKMYRFTNNGVFRHQIEPKDKKEAALAPENWTEASDNFYAYDPARLGCLGVTETSLLVYILSAVDLSKIGTPVSLCVFGKRQLHYVQLRMEGKQRIKAGYIVKSPGKSVRIKKEVEVFKVAMVTEPMESDLAETENFSFLGLQKDIAIYIDPATRLPLLVSGMIPGVGKVDLTLYEAQLKPDEN
jgi:hypothetical protein